MFKLLVNDITGEQRIIKVEQTGGYFDASRVLWDERTNGTLPNIAPGKMVRNGAVLDTLLDYLPDHAAWMASQQAAADAAAKKTAIDSETKNDGDLAVLRQSSGDEINVWFDVNVTNLNQTIKMLKKVVKSLVKQGLL